MKSYIFTLITKLFASSMTIKGRLDQINTKQNAKFILTFAFSQFYWKLLLNNLVKKLFDQIDFSFNGDSNKKTVFSLKMLLKCLKMVE